MSENNEEIRRENPEDEGVSMNFVDSGSMSVENEEPGNFEEQESPKPAKKRSSRKSSRKQEAKETQTPALPEDGDSIVSQIEYVADSSGNQGFSEEGKSEDGEFAEPAAKMHRLKVVGGIFNRKIRMPALPGKVLSYVGKKIATPVSIILLVTMFAAIGVYVRNQYLSAKYVLSEGPERAYALLAEGNAEGARQMWAQINAKSHWYMPFSGFLTSIDQPYLQKATLAYKAEDWTNVAENAYKALQVPITDQQAVYVQQMILQATANIVKAYLPNQKEQPIRGGVPDHAPPICEPSAAYVWVVPAMLVILAGLCLYKRMRVLFALVALSMPLYFWGVSVHNDFATRTCDLRLTFNPERINLYGPPSIPLPAFTPTPLKVETAPQADAQPAERPAVSGNAAEMAQTMEAPVFVPGEALRIDPGNAPEPVSPKPATAPSAPAKNAKK